MLPVVGFIHASAHPWNWNKTKLSTVGWNEARPSAVLFYFSFISPCATDFRRVLNIAIGYIGQNLSPTTRHAPALGSHSYQTLSAVDLSFFGHLHHADPRQNHHRALQACFSGPPVSWETEDRSFKAILAYNSGGWPATNEPWTSQFQIRYKWNGDAIVLLGWPIDAFRFSLNWDTRRLKCVHAIWVCK